MKYQYFVNDEKGIVVCLITDDGKKFRGVSRCNFSAGDTFNEEYGRRIAYARASIARLKWLRKYTYNESDWYLKNMMEWENKGAAITRKLLKAHTSLNTLLGHD